jgi:hypothetical protein
MTDMEILQLADQCGVIAVTKHEWDGKQFNHTDDYLDGDGAALIIFAKLIAQKERDRIYAEELELPKPRLTGKFSITAGKFKCTGCTGIWTDREDAKQHSCKDYQ